jgi:Protein of unknown function (DUF3300)
MKAELHTRRWLVRLAIATIAVVVGLATGLARAEEAGGSPRSAAQLEQLVAPIALYPDSLLAQVLMASTYPLEVVEAERWTQANSDISGEERLEALQKQPWDPSVRGLTAIPQTLQMMSDQPDWMQALGEAFLARQQAVLDAIQRLRSRADAAGNLETTPQQKVSRVAAPASPGSNAPAETVYTIEPPTVDEYYLPFYDTKAVFGRWPYPDSLPFTWYPPGYVADGVLAFAAGVTVGSAIWGRVDWWNHRVNINVNRYNRFNRTNLSFRRNAWAHDPAHRGNVPYRDKEVAARFADQAKAAAAREASGDKGDVERREAGERTKSDAAKSDAAKSADATSGDSDKSAKSKKSARSERSARSGRHGGGWKGKRRGRRR